MKFSDINEPKPKMTPAEYRAARRARGTQQGVARALGVDCRTIQRREAGDITISSEACRALLSLPVTGKSKKHFAKFPDV